MSHEESKWLNYEEELVWIKLYLSEDIFEDLLDETLFTLNSLH